MVLNDAMRVRVIRALLGMSSAAFADRIGISAGTVTAWEHGRTAPQGANRESLAKLCQENGIAFLPSGFPAPLVDAILFNPKENHG